MRVAREPTGAEPRPEQAETDGAAEHEEQDTEGLRFDDPYWDDAFCAWGDPTMRTCCG